MTSLDDLQLLGRRVEIHQRSGVAVHIARLVTDARGSISSRIAMMRRSWPSRGRSTEAMAPK